MATVTKTIGTDSKDYSTITAWEAASYGATGSDDAVGEVYNDSVFDETLTMNDATPLSVLLTVPVAERHDGTAGTGARLVYSSGGGNILAITGGPATTVEWIELGSTATANRGLYVSIASFVLSHSIIHNISNVGLADGVRIEAISTIHNSIIYAVSNTASDGTDAACLRVSGGTQSNCTIYGCTNDNGSGDSLGLSGASTTTTKNMVVAGVGGTTSGSALDYTTSGSWGTSDYNASEDATAPDGGNSITTASDSDFVSVVGGSEDLHLASGAVEIDAGVDLGTTPTDVNYDINNRDRDAEGDVWDMGCHELVVSSGATTASVMSSIYRLYRGEV